ncbi:MAG: TRL domain-containing protein [Leptospiraceae bacterium]|nr:TRL domain-containing protein [Leptospiraceae bacterium]
MIGCAVGPTHGVLFTSTEFPGQFNQNNDVNSTKTGKGCIHTVLSGLFAWGEAGAGMIAYKKGIKKLATIDHSTLSILSYDVIHIYRNYCTIVSGE